MNGDKVFLRSHSYSKKEMYKGSKYISPEARALALKQGHCFISSDLRRPRGGVTFIRRNTGGDISFVSIDKPEHRPWSNEEDEIL